MATTGQMTGMRGVYLVAAELTRLGFIVSPTSRSARGADLLVTDQECQKAWSVQVKTNQKPASNWLVNKHALTLKSDNHVYGLHYVFVNLRVYVFVNLRGIERAEYVVARVRMWRARFAPNQVRRDRSGMHSIAKTSPPRMRVGAFLAILTQL